MNRTHVSYPNHARGFSLVEILVGVAIGIVGMLVIFRTVAVWDTHTRTTTSGSDAQGAGNLAMFNVERDIRQAGLGFMGIGPATGAPPVALGCNVAANDTVNGPFNFNLVPVQIVLTPNAPDEIRVLYGNSSFFVSEEKFTASTNASKKLDRRNGFKPGDLAIAADAADCTLLQVTDDTNPDGKTILHAGGARFNSAGAGPAFAAGLGKMYSLGPAPSRNSWRVDVGRARLTTTDLFVGPAALEVAEGVVNMKALYGMDTNADRVVDQWTNVSPATPAQWAQVLSIRVGLLVRSRQFERTADQSASGVPQPVTPVAPTWSGVADAAPGVDPRFVMTNVDGTPNTFGIEPDPNNWRYYRYRVYEKVIPLRNVIWGTGPGSTAIVGG
jgi:type IV pilus assembly protein PilW